jgi:glutamate-ammonia-ligase adenylyltransferase
MALLRARPLYGSAAAKAALGGVIETTLLRPREPAKLIADAVRMRGEIAAHKPAAGPLDIKLGPGGLVDLEFAIHILQLRHGIGLDPRLEQAVTALAAAGLVEAGIGEALCLLTRMLVMFRLVAPSSAAPPEATRPLVAAACGLADWTALLAAHDSARQRVSALWRRVAAEAGE